jgi:hypothetical protein
LLEKGCTKAVSVQRICKVARDEREVHEILNAIWEHSNKTEEILEKVAKNNEDIDKLERMLDSA